MNIPEFIKIEIELNERISKGLKVNKKINFIHLLG
jgi:hypothetical protein